MFTDSPYDKEKIALSFELFPPKTEKGEAKLYEHVEKLMEFSPEFITCTYGAGGSTQNKTLGITRTVKERFNIPVASHLTVVGSTVDQLREYLTQAQQQGVDYIVALRGDPPKGDDTFQATKNGLSYANELVDLIHAEFSDFGVFVAGYPETHREAPSPEADLDNLKRKVDAGAHAIITQLYYDNDDFFRFRDNCQKRGINVPIVPGLLPVTDFVQIQRISALCGAKLPPKFVEALSNTDDPFQVGIEQAVAQIQELQQAGIEGLHLYVLNRSSATVEIMNHVNMTPTV